MGDMQYNRDQLDNICGDYQKIMDMQTNFYQSEPAYEINTGATLTKDALVFGVWQMFHTLVPRKTDECLTDVLIDAHIIADIEPLEQQYLGVFNHSDSYRFLQLEGIGNVFDSTVRLGDFWIENERASVQLGYEWYMSAILYYIDFLRASWNYTKDKCRNVSHADIEPYLAEIRDRIVSHHQIDAATCNENAYQKLCKDVEGSYLYAKFSAEQELFWESTCKKEINLWTYWQGMNVRHPKILVVGQDWGCPARYPKTIANIDAMNHGGDWNYFVPDEAFLADVHLAELLRELGYDDIIGTKYDNLFFTNLVLGYRTRKSSGNCKPEWIEKDLPFFFRLVNILQPKVILCLGKDTYEGVLRAFGKDSPIKNDKYYQFIEKRIVSKIDIGYDRSALVFPLAHCGSCGTMNRNATCGRNSADLTAQKSDWRFVMDYIQLEV